MVSTNAEGRSWKSHHIHCEHEVRSGRTMRSPRVLALCKCTSEYLQPSKRPWDFEPPSNHFQSSLRHISIACDAKLTCSYKACSSEVCCTTCGAWSPRIPVHEPAAACPRTRRTSLLILRHPVAPAEEFSLVYSFECAVCTCSS